MSRCERMKVNRRVMRFKASGPCNDPVHPRRQMNNGNIKEKDEAQISILDESKKPRRPARGRIGRAIREKHQTAVMLARFPIRAAR